MRKIENTNLEALAPTLTTLQNSEAVNPISHKSYHELRDRPVVEVDALNQLHANIAQLTDLQARLSFVMREVRYLLKA